jgi:N-acetylmuramate 1-kinase
VRGQGAPPAHERGKVVCRIDYPRGPPGTTAEPTLNNDPSTPAIAWPDTQREHAFAQWLEGVAPSHGLARASLRSASSDASFRRYFRVDGEGGASFIVMDAPPPLEDVRPFIGVAALHQRAGLNAPRVLEADVVHGFLLLTDLGSKLYLDVMNEAVARGEMKAADMLMRDAIAALVQWQARADASTLPAYDDALLRRELQLFPDWCVARECGVTWSATERATWDAACDLLVASALAQPTVAVHRDYMPRNLMVAIPNPGILDFQDAVRGPISYDVAS